ncbi:ubiquinol-cytochrome C chaperone family protein [Undibacter mobilis]|uniref:Ubiquinol-cytochrome C chaperone n=1 Tax=Undibacter mobilis TaxID=2292256 RepID=A0A371B1G0_9BRAD|nr:ubiquinol-cytochrome C chaperone family protein [Undibacter mobilis]RDV01344.1 ubiquinol-cytochrome C chaperone [Undibacter mobilis]
MIFSLFRRKPQRDTISALYGMIVAQARLPVFYRDYAVADTVNGRFDLIVLHLALVLERLTVNGQLEAAGQAVFDHFCRDMDDNLREMGISDLKVPKEMKRMGEAFYGRSRSYLDALDDRRALVTALTRNIYGGAPSAYDAAPRLADYVTAAAAALKTQDVTAIAAGAVQFPDPARVPAPAA